MALNCRANQYGGRCSSFFSLGKEQKCHVSMKGNSVILEIQEDEFEHQYAQDAVSLRGRGGFKTSCLLKCEGRKTMTHWTAPSSCLLCKLQKDCQTWLQLYKQFSSFSCKKKEQVQGAGNSGKVQHSLTLSRLVWSSGI